jgi:hypothetical protein
METDNIPPTQRIYESSSAPPPHGVIAKTGG